MVVLAELVSPVGSTEQTVSGNFYEITMTKVILGTLQKLFLGTFNGYGLFPTEKPKLILLLLHKFHVIKAWLLRTY